jgi:hypothetical protein
MAQTGSRPSLLPGSSSTKLFEQQVKMPRSRTNQTLLSREGTQSPRHPAAMSEPQMQKSASSALTPKQVRQNDLMLPVSPVEEEKANFTLNNSLDHKY